MKKIIDKARRKRGPTGCSRDTMHRPRGITLIESEGDVEVDGVDE
jgi:hypothetical protein